MSHLNLDDSLQMIRETLCVAQSAIALADSSGTLEDRDRLQRMIDEIDRQRPLGPDGKHGNRHTPTCGCTDIPQEETDTNPLITLVSRLTSAMNTYENLAKDALKRRNFGQIEKCAYLADGFRSSLSFVLEAFGQLDETPVVGSATQQP